MADSLSASLLGMLDMHSVGGIAGALGASEQAVLQGLKPSIASVLGGMAFKSEDPNALRNILDLASSSSGDATLTQMANAAADANSPLISGGRRLIYLQLSQKRANSVMAELVSKRVSADSSVPRDKARSTHR